MQDSLNMKIKEFQDILEKCYLIRPGNKETAFEEDFNELLTKTIEDCCKLRIYIKSMDNNTASFLIKKLTVSQNKK